MNYWAKNISKLHLLKLFKLKLRIIYAAAVILENYYMI